MLITFLPAIGSLLAVGCNDGRVIIWDFDTRGVARILIGHVETISSVSWSRNGRRLLSASGVSKHACYRL